jgi:serine/threonine-protein kinase
MSETFGRYTVVRQLGRGAMGVVYLATDPVLNRQVAVKTVELGVEDPKEREFLREQLLRDARAAAVLKHPNIVGIYDVFEEGVRAYVVMEYIEGENLATLLKKNPLPESTLTLKVLRQMADALDYTHARGVIHRDIKPANVMIDAAGTAKIMDFGIARISDSRTCTPTGMVMGTVEYMAPEQILGAPVDGRADQFAMAVVAYQMMTGSTLFGPNTVATLTYKVVHEAPALPSTRNARLPRGVDAVLYKGLAKNPVERFASCSELVSALALAFSEAPTAPVTSSTLPTMPSAPRAATTMVLPPPPRKSQAPLMAALAVVVLLGGALAAMIWKPWNQATESSAAVAVPAVTKDAGSTARVEKPRSKPVATPDPKPPEPAPETKTEPAKVASTIAPKVPPPIREPDPVEEPEAVALPDESKSDDKSAPFSQAMHRGGQLVKQNDYPDALQAFNQAVALRPQGSHALYMRGTVYQHLGKCDLAMNDYTAALHSEPKMAVAFVGLGGCLVHLHRDDEAFVEFEQALKYKPDAVLALTGRGNIYLRRKQYRLALADYDKALAVNATYAPALSNRAHARDAVGDFAGASADRKREAALHK